METGANHGAIIINNVQADSQCDNGIDIQLPDTSSESSSGGVSIHNDLTDIQGGTLTERYHLTKNQWDAVRLANVPSSSNVFLTTLDTPDTAAIQAEIDAIKAATVVHPIYTAPTVTITSPQTGSNYEIGQSISPVLTVNYTPNDGGTATYQILKGGTLLSPTQTYTDAIVVTAAGVTYQGKATYIGTQPPYKTNNFGDLDSTGIIPASNITSSAIAMRGFYREFWGPVSSTPVDSASVRALSSTQLTSGVNPFTLNTGTTLLKFAFWIPTGKSLVTVKDSTSSNADITTQFISSALSVFDASGTALVSGTLYVMTVAQAYSPSHAFLITTT